MKIFFSKPYRWAVVFSFLLIGSFTFTLFDTFVIPKTFTAIETASAAEISTSTQASILAETDPIITANSYEDENIKITIDTVCEYNSTIYIADIQVSDASYLKTALAGNVYGRNIKEKTSEMAEENDAIFAINGDYYGFRDDGYVLRNGVAYRDTASNAEALLIDAEGDFSIINENEVGMESLSSNGAWQVLSFGPALIENGEIVVDGTSEVSQSKTSNPRTAIGQISELHYVVIVSDGRTSESEGLSLLELAQEFEEMGCTTAYNLDGGGSSTMYFNGEIINNPTDGRSISERGERHCLFRILI